MSVSRYYKLLEEKPYAKLRRTLNKGRYSNKEAKRLIKYHGKG
jgi:hypothetical protein